MSRGLGRIERAILNLVEDMDDEGWEERYEAQDLASRVFGEDDSDRDYDAGRLKYRQWRAQRRAKEVAILRAMHSLARKFPDRVALMGGKGRDPLWISKPSEP
jgi:hypothetical protein